MNTNQTNNTKIKKNFSSGHSDIIRVFRVGSKGFTLIEIMISIAVMAILSGIMIAYSGVNKKQIVLFTEQAKINGVLNRAKALSFQKFKSEIGIRIENCGFGVYFSSTTGDYIIFEDKVEGGVCSYSYNPENEEIESFKLPPQLVFLQAPEIILFIPPYLITTSTSELPTSIILQTIDGLVEASIEVGSGGEITSY